MSEFEEKKVENGSESMEQALKNVQEVTIGDVVKAEVLVLEDRQIVVGIVGSGVEGVVPVKELTSEDVENMSDIVSVGDILDLVVIQPIGQDKENGSYLLSKRRLEERKIWSEVEEEFKADHLVEGTVINAVRGGLIVDLGIRGFVPASMVSTHFVTDFSQYKGQTLKFKIIEIDPKENRLILSHKAVLEAERSEKMAEIFDTLHVGDVVEGTVARLTNFGAFVDLGGVDGLVHISEISHAHISKPSDALEVGQKVSVRIQGLDSEKERISLSIKATQPGPWDSILEQAPVGSVLTGKIKRLTSFGAFVELFPEVEGLVHISQISHKRIATPQEVLHEGDEVQVKVLDVKPEDHRISLSIKALEEQPEELKEAKKPAREKKPAEEKYEMPEESSGFSLGDLLGDQLKDLDTDNK
ncbi:30S ribosomal protein S1 [Enterococcus timonensis]|uniref:30S ribosomal protein S1 n=1 Tax=Enterococcus timonensis TaxID=1852364 RepID=UPI0008DA735E|nr:30S ribosomal protein S1 [Enterococcus timonensis]